MKLTELIVELQNKLEENGDLEVIQFSESDYDSSNLEVWPLERNHIMKTALSSNEVSDLSTNSIMSGPGRRVELEIGDEVILFTIN